MTWLWLACGGSDPIPAATERFRDRAPAVLDLDCGGGAAWANLQDAIDAARSGDTIRVAAGTCYGSIDFVGKTVRIEARDGVGTTTLASSPGSAAVSVKSGEGPGTALVGLRITGGGGLVDSAIEVSLSTLLLQDVTVEGNVGVHALHARSTDIDVVRTTFVNNTASSGVVVFAQRGHVLWKDSTLVCGGIGTGLESRHGAFLLDGGTLNCAGTTGFLSEHSVGRMMRVVVDGTTELQGEFDDAMAVINGVQRGPVVADAVTLVVRNTVFDGAALDVSNVSGGPIENNVFFGGACGVDGATAGLTVRNNTFFNVVDPHCGSVADYVGVNGNLADDPQFVDAAAHDYHLLPTSTLIDAGFDTPLNLDVDGSRADIGVYGGRFGLGGGW